MFERALLAALRRFDLAAVLREIACPLVLVNGARRADRLARRTYTRFATDTRGIRIGGV